MRADQPIEGGAGEILVGIAGAGFIARFHADALRTIPGIRLTAVCDSDPEKARRFQRERGVPECYHSLEEMLERTRAGVVHVLLPPPLHERAAVACLESGRDVFLEKPLADSAAAAERILACTRRTGRQAGVNHNYRFHPAFLQLLDWVRDWGIGKPYHISVFMNVPLRQLDAGQHSAWMLRAPEHILLEQGVHPLSLIHALAGPVRRATCLVGGDRRLNTGVVFFTSWQIQLECEAATASLNLSYKPGFMDAWVHVLGEDGTALADLRRNQFVTSGVSRFFDPADNLLDAWRKARQLLAAGAGGFLEYAGSQLLRRPASDPFNSGMRASITAFYEDLRSGVPLRCGAEEGADLLRACELILAAMEQERPAARRHGEGD